MPPRKQKLAAKAGAGGAAAATTTNDEDLDAMLDAAIRENQAVAGSPAALRLEQEQREARERAEHEQREAREKAAAEAEAAQYICGTCGAGQARQRCSGCATVRYCGEQCQVAHWQVHKARCRVLRAEAAVAVAEAEVKAVREEAKEDEQEVVHNPDTEAGNCWTCGADNPRNLCNRCKVTKYCGVACQTENWPIHKGRCAVLKGLYADFDRCKDDMKKVKAGVRKSQGELNIDLYFASALGRIVDIERIIAAGGRVNVPASHPAPLLGAATEGHVRAIGVLVRHGAQVNALDERVGAAIHSASQHGQLKAVAALLEHGAQIDLRDSDGASPLFMASQSNHIEVAAFLLEHGAQVDLPIKIGATPLMVSVQQGYVAMARLLLQHGAQVDSRDNDGCSALYAASQCNHLEVVALLLQKGAKVDLATKTGVTALGNSAYHGQTAMVRLLLNAGADPLYRNVNGGSPLEAANHQNHPEIVALLRARIAEIVRERRA